jgi:hypothetical protein
MKSIQHLYHLIRVIFKESVLIDFPFKFVVGLSQLFLFFDVTWNRQDFVILFIIQMTHVKVRNIIEVLELIVSGFVLECSD